MGRLRDDRNLEHHAAAGEDLCERGDRAGALFPKRRAVRQVVQGQEGQVSGAAGADAAENLDEEREGFTREEREGLSRASRACVRAFGRRLRTNAAAAAIPRAAERDA